MEMKSIIELCTLNMGQSPNSETYNEHGIGLPFYQGNADFGEIHPTTHIWCSKPVKIANIGDILISVRAPIGALNIAAEKCCIGRGLAALTPKYGVCDRMYLYYALHSQVDFLIKQGTGSTFKAIGKKVLEETLIPIHSLEKQEQIAKSFDCIDKIINKKKHQVLLLDEFIRSRFVERFGTLQNNQNRYDIVLIGDVCSMIKDGTHQTPKYTEDIDKGYKFLSSKDVMTQKIDWSDIRYIPADLHEKLYATIKPQRNDILMSKNGVNYGVAAVNDTDEVFDIYVSLALLRPTKVINPVYLKWVINNPDTKYQFDRSIKGIGVPNLHLGEIKKTRILLPPLELQNHFVDFACQVDKSKLAIQKSLEKLEILKKSLMQQYFG